MKQFIFLIPLLLLFLIVFYFVSTKEEVLNVCDLNCSIITATCPDNFIASCNSTCDPLTRTCVNCIPDCTGHETPAPETSANQTELVLCPQIIPPHPDFCKDGKIQPLYDKIGCIIGYECV